MKRLATVSGMTLLLLALPAFTAAAQSFKKQAQVIAQNQESFEILFANCYALAGEAALEACDRALELDPENEALWTNRGAVLQGDLQQYEGALEAYERAIAIAPDYSLALYNHCNVLSRVERYPEALVSCDRALAGDGRWGNIQPSFAWDTKGLILSKLGRYQDSLVAHTRAVEIDPTDPVSWYNHGVALMDLNRDREALRSFERALELNPDYEAAQHNRDILRQRLNQ
ncbi:MAG: tetratricopeptide repeat protein [Jaaginema sp. PMC 1079.18]|nr:tetratricopeptide repeat protein [Jaaginema sp. PMC 1080.18]MEC4851921.1 tetratricopeptide repeat protein [Jaaginema sp. PMC 1079.18]MEC4865548.1 tetratricopeptide repeat protein [Jaaginema sp. PMC 1078.18]